MKKYKADGFTLLEVMVALAVAAIGLGAISKSMSSSVDVAARLKHRTLATWVASNRLAELRMNRQFSISGSSSGESDMGDLRWRYEEQYASTADPNISRVDISVYLDGEDDQAAELTGFLSRYKPAQRSN